MARRPYRQAGWLVVLLLCVGCQEALSPQARQLLQNGYAASTAGNNQTVIDSMDAFLRDNAKSARADEAYYLRGLAKYHSGDLAGAKADLQAALDRTGKKEVAGKAALALGDLAWDADDMPAASDKYATAIVNINSSAPPADHAAYRLGCALQRLGRWQEADVQFSRVAELFAGGELASRAGRRMHCRAWTIQAGAFDNKSRAEAAARELVSRNLPASVQPTMGEGKLLFVVQVGRYSNHEQAAAALPSISQYQPDAFVAATR